MIKGFINQGSLCYRNVVFQILFQLEEVMHYLQQILPDPGLPITKAVLEVYAEYRQPSPSPVMNFPKELQFFYSHDQNDAHEYLILLLDRIDEELKKRGRSFNDTFFNHHQLSRFMNQHDPEDIKLITMAENILLLPYTGSLEESFQKIFTTDLLSEWESERYGKKTFPALRTNSISRWPPYLFILVHRYTQDHHKIHHKMHFPLTFRDYSFQGCVNHFGNMQHGHYMCVIKKDPHFLLCNDEQVAFLPLDKLPVYMENAYLLLYSRKSTRE